MLRDEGPSRKSEEGGNIGASKKVLNTKGSSNGRVSKRGPISGG